MIRKKNMRKYCELDTMSLQRAGNKAMPTQILKF